MVVAWLDIFIFILFNSGITFETFDKEFNLNNKQIYVYRKYLNKIFIIK